MGKTTADQAAAQRAAILAAAERIVIDRGWEGLTVRAIEAETQVSRTVVSDTFAGVELKKALISTAFSYVRSIASEADRGERMFLATLRDRVLDLFRGSQEAATLMVRCCAEIRAISTSGVAVSLHFFGERTSAVGHIAQSCDLPELAIERLIDWYIAAATVLQVTSIATIDDLPDIGRFDPGLVI